MKNRFINNIKLYAINIGICFIEIIKGAFFEISKNFLFKNNLVYDNISINTNIGTEKVAKLLAAALNLIPGIVTLGINNDDGKYKVILNCIDGNSESTINHFIKVKECFENNLIKLEK